MLPSSSTHKKKKKKTGRPRMDDRKAMSAIFYVLRTGCQWKALPRMILYFKCFNALAVLYRSMLKELDFLLNSEGHHFKWTEFG